MNSSFKFPSQHVKADQVIAIPQLFDFFSHSVVGLLLWHYSSVALTGLYQPSGVQQVITHVTVE